jgi:hypothetical protein
LIEKVDTSHEAVKKTGKAFFIAFSIIAAVIFLKHSHTEGWTGWNWSEGIEALWWKIFLVAGPIIYLLSYIAYPVMKPFHVAWMKFAFILGWFWTRAFLSIFFYLIITPTGLLMKLFGKDLLDEKIDKSAKSYWIKRDLNKFDPKHAARTF